MKKFLVVLLALAMILAVASTAMAADTAIPDYNDTTTSTEYASDIYRLTALGVLEGNTGWGGAYRPADNLTRAEFAKIACYMFGKQSQVNYYKAQPSAFSDVEEGFWAEGWINCANDNGLMIGIGGGKFAPQANVTKQEVATVVLRAVGYTDELPGAWPADYIAKSQKVIAPFADESLFDYVEKIDGTAATRAEMAAIVNYALSLYRVSYVGNQLMVQGISTADLDGYTYKDLKTNEADIYNFFLGLEVGDVEVDIPIGKGEIELTVDPNLTTRETLLWDVFHAITVPYFFETWYGYGDYEDQLTPYRPQEQAKRLLSDRQFIEASGWGYEDFKKGELLFSDEFTGTQMPVASDYYIFDDSLDGELWQVGARLALMTVQVDVSEAKISKLMKGNLHGLEALYVQMLTDVDYVEENDDYDNADVFTLDLDGFFGTNLNDIEYAYDYDWFKHEDFGIVEAVNKNEIVIDFDPYPGAPGLEDYKGDDIFCIETGCDDHNQAYVILKDGKLQDPTCLKVDDVVYDAGTLVYDYDALDPDEKGKNVVELFIAYTPVAGTLDKLSSPGNPSAEYSLTISGDKYQYCYNNDAHQYSEGGYAADADYYNMTYQKMMGYVKEDCKYAIGYGKLYVATLIFDAAFSNEQYGVLTDFATDFDYLPAGGAVTATGASFFGADEATNSYDFDEELYLGTIFQDQTIYRNLLGALTNYSLDKEDKIDVDTIGDRRTGDVGIVLPTMLTPVAQAVKFDDDGRTEDYARANNLTGITGAAPKSFQGMQITEDTIIFEVSGGWDIPEGGGFPVYEFDSVKLGNPDDYIGHTVAAQQMAIFAWDNKDITVLYVRNVHFNGDIVMGVFNSVTYDGDNYLIEFEDGTVLTGPESQMSIFANLADGERYYGVYKVQDGEVSNVVLSGTAPADVPAGTLYVLFAEDGYMMDSATVSNVLINYCDPADRTAGFFTGINDVTDLADDCVYVDMTGDGDFDRDFFGATGSHSGDGKYVYYIVFKDATQKIYQIFRFDAEDFASTPIIPVG